MRYGLHLVLVSTAMLICGCKVSSPGKVDRSVINFTKHKITVHGRDDKNPLPFNAENLAAGKEAFSHYCVACHGLDGQNTGVPFADRMSPPPPLLTSAEVQSYTDGQLKWVIDYGVSPSGMPASKGTLSDDEIWSIVHYIRHLPPAGSLGEPEMYSH
jgi:cytochrome c553